jgi:hypothetical protein
MLDRHLRQKWPCRHIERKGFLAAEAAPAEATELGKLAGSLKPGQMKDLKTKNYHEMKLDNARLPVSIEATFWRLWLWRTNGGSFRWRRRW